MTTVEIAANAVGTPKEDKRAKNNVSRMEERVLLELLIAVHGLTMALRRIDHTPAGQTLSLGRETKDPAKPDDRCGA